MNLSGNKTEVVNREGIEKALLRIAHEILEQSSEPKNLALIGIRTRGEFIAKRLAVNISKISGLELPVGFLGVTFYRDDFRERLAAPEVKGTDISFSIDGLTIILADDVLYSGRTVRAALSEIIDLGRPNQIMLAVLVDRGHREMPIKADFVGKNVPTADNEHVYVRLEEVDSEDAIYLEKFD
ncbi:MAG: bifunctional pyr operon transcriptional regulator/uracil phosphoribosyltransferase PyrR [Fidelibacterota bacterium]